MRCLGDATVLNGEWRFSVYLPPQLPAGLRGQGRILKPPPFAYVRPASLDEAAGLLSEDDGAVLLAGGQSLVPMLNLRLARPSTVVDISGLTGLAGIEWSADRVTIGALATQYAVETHPWPDSLAALPHAVANIAYPAIRHRGTVGGSLAHADPSAELPTVTTALGAGIHLRSVRGDRRVPAEDFFVGYFSTARDPDEIVVALDLPLRPRMRTGFAEFSRRPGDFAVALAATATWEGPMGKFARVVVGGLDMRPRRIDTFERALLEGEDWRDHCTPEVLSCYTEPVSDIHGSSEYRLHVGAELVRLALERMEGGSS